MVTYQIPHQARFLTPCYKFSSLFNSTPGGYLFGETAVLLDLQPSTVYFINTISVGGNISESIYLDAVNDFLQIYLRRQKSNQLVYGNPLPLSNYFDGNEAAAFVISDRYADQLLLRLEGELNGTAALVGVSPVTIQVQFNMFAINSAFYNGAYRDSLSDKIGQSLRV